MGAAQVHIQHRSRSSRANLLRVELPGFKIHYLARFRTPAVFVGGVGQRRLLRRLRGRCLCVCLWLPGAVVEASLDHFHDRLAVRGNSHSLLRARIFRKKVTGQTIPKVIPPRSRVRLVDADKLTHAWRKEVGRRFRIGYYSRQDGLDCIWLVNDNGEYEQTTDREFLLKYFEIERLSDETNFYGTGKRRLAKLKKITSSATRS